MKRIKFEHLFSFSLLAVLTACVFLFKENSDIVNIIVGALIGGFSGSVAFFFTKHNSNGKNNKDE
ncbi:hypothetical protein JOC78_002441 [Bacillus ectoiniformans]|uniref:hypothetical protein n=1 Tax=Bacillus ectoiniformans TaxID=1494429 RepID=UPI00195C90EB|nr:hypothetical protein [Bacillus ectoiniformans]MBM7649488.1 hypothetical protein [Bacillus ectoiniformans]